MLWFAHETDVSIITSGALKTGFIYFIIKKNYFIVLVKNSFEKYEDENILKE